MSSAVSPDTPALPPSNTPPRQLGEDGGSNASARDSSQAATTANTAAASTSTTSQTMPPTATNAAQQLLREFAQQIGGLQGQLPPSAQDSQQQLLRQLADWLSQPTGQGTPTLASDTRQLLTNWLTSQSAQQYPQQPTNPVANANNSQPPATLGSWLNQLGTLLPPASPLVRSLLLWATQISLSSAGETTTRPLPTNVSNLPAPLSWPSQPASNREQLALDNALASTLRLLRSWPTTDTEVSRHTAASTIKVPVDASVGQHSPPTSPTESETAPTTYRRPFPNPALLKADGSEPGIAAQAKPGDGKASAMEGNAATAQTNKLPAGITLQVDAASTRSTTTNEEEAPDLAPNVARTVSPNPVRPTAASQTPVAAIPDPGSSPSTNTPVAGERPAIGLAATPPAAANLSAQPLPPLQQPMPLGDFLHQLSGLLARRNLPELLRPALQQIDKVFTTPLTQPTQMEEWFSFLRQPLLGDSGQSKALLQWGIALLTYRLQQQTAPTSTPGNLPPANLAKEETNPGQWAHRATQQLLQQAERLTPSPPETPPWMLPQIPLPPHYSGGRGGQLALRRQTGEAGRTQWVISFSLEPEQLGPIRIKAFLDLPEIRLQTVAERAQTVEKMRQQLPILENRLRELGLQPAPSQCRQDKVVMAEAPTVPTATDGLSVRI